jgi:hypothetical protein
MTETGGRISRMGVLDLTTARSPEDLGTITAIEDVGVVLVPEHLMMALLRIPLRDVDNIVPVPRGGKHKLLIGQTRLPGETLAAGDAETICVVVGELFVTTPVAEVGYRGLWITGQLLAPRGSENAIGAKIHSLAGQVLYYPHGARFLPGSTVIDREFLERLRGPRPLVIVGTASFADDVPGEMLRNNVTEIILSGTIDAPAALVPLLRVLTEELVGAINTRE